MVGAGVDAGAEDVEVSLDGVGAAGADDVGVLERAAAAEDSGSVALAAAAANCGGADCGIGEESACAVIGEGAICTKGGTGSCCAGGAWRTRLKFVFTIGMGSDRSMNWLPLLRVDRLGGSKLEGATEAEAGCAAAAACGFGWLSVVLRFDEAAGSGAAEVGEGAGAAAVARAAAVAAA